MKRGGILRMLRVGDRVRVVIRSVGFGRMVEVYEEEGTVRGFVQASGEVVPNPGRSSTAAILERPDHRPLLFTPGRDRLLGVGDAEEGGAE